MIVFSVSLLLLFSLSFVSANWFTDLFKGDVQLSEPVISDCSTGCTLIQGKKLNVNSDGATYEIYPSLIRKDSKGEYVNVIIKNLKDNKDKVVSNKVRVGEEIKFGSSILSVKNIYYGPKDDDIMFSVSEGVKCEDSDGGKDYYVKGVTSVPSDYVNKKDVCKNELGEFSVEIFPPQYTNPNTLAEYSCGIGDYLVEYFECSQGCSDGACVKEKIPTDNGEVTYQGVLSMLKEACEPTSFIYMTNGQITGEQSCGGMNKVCINGYGGPVYPNTNYLQESYSGFVSCDTKVGIDGGDPWPVGTKFKVQYVCCSIP